MTSISTIISRYVSGNFCLSSHLSPYTCDAFQTIALGWDLSGSADQPFKSWFSSPCSSITNSSYFQNLMFPCWPQGSECLTWGTLVLLLKEHEKVKVSSIVSNSVRSHRLLCLGMLQATVLGWWPFSPGSS